MLRLFMTFSGSKTNNQQVNLEVYSLIAVLWWRKMLGVQLQMMFTFWFGQDALNDKHLILFGIPLFSETTRFKRSFSCRSSAKKEFERVYWHLLQCLFFLVFTLSQTLWFDAQFPKLMVILFFDLNSRQIFYEIDAATWCKGGYLCLWLSSEFSELCSTCSSSFVFRKPKRHL